ncbi:hypothetical protein BGZ82_002704, partial [Podila clonocystis]
AAEWDATGTTPNWHLEYSARAAYGAYVPINATQPLSASWWHDVTTAFEKTPAAFQKYWTYRGKSTNLQAACEAGSACQKEMICDLRAGKSSDACSGISFSLKREDEEADAMDPSGLHSLYKRAEPKPWNVKNCGLTSSL